MKREESEQLLASQFTYLSRLKKMKEGKLRSLHNNTFIGTKYALKVPKWMHRSVIERRLFYYFCMKNYHFPKCHPIRKEFFEKARFFLSDSYISNKDPAKDAKERLREHEFFTATNVRAMPITEVDRYLTILGLYVEATQKQRRKILWEWFHKPASELVLHYNAEGKKVAPRRKGKLNNKYKLRDLILEHPRLQFDEFMDHFGNEMPTVTRASYNNARSILRKAGYDIPNLKPASSSSVVVTGPYGKPTIGRLFNDTTILKATKHGQEDEEDF